MRREAKISSQLIAVFFSLVGFMDPDKMYFTWRLSTFGAILSFLYLCEVWEDHLQRMIIMTLFIFCLNSVIDEMIGDPYTFGINEKIFALLATANFIYHTKKDFKEWIHKLLR